MISGTPKISIGEDDASHRIALVSLIRSCGYDAEGFETAEAFLASHAPEVCACVVTDVNLPGMDGFSLRSRLAGRGITTPVIMITGRPTPDLEVRAMRSGATAFLGKPLEHGRLVASVETALAIRGQ